jgi:zinc/manganese transport system ATP-binding protein
MTSQTLSALYGVPVEVIRTGSRILVAGVPDEHVHEHDHVGAAE